MIHILEDSLLKYLKTLKGLLVKRWEHYAYVELLKNTHVDNPFKFDSLNIL